MSFNVRIYGHQGIVAMKVVNDSGQQHSDSVYQLSQPYIWTQNIPVSASAASSTVVTPASLVAAGSPFATDVSAVLRIEVPDGQAIRYELNPPNRSAVAGASSSKMSGADQFQWGTGWTISIIDASGLA